MARTIPWKESVMVSICDADLYGRTVKGDGIEMHISKEHFGGDLVNRRVALELIRRSAVANLAGNGIVEEAVEGKLASGLAVREIGGVSFLIILKP